MGKYMRRKCGGAAGGGEAAPAAVVLGGGVRTRSRSAAAVAVAVAGCTAGKRKRRAEATTAPAEAAGSGCYLHLRSRRLFIPVVATRGDLAAAEEEASTSRMASSGASAEAIAVGISRCSSAASSSTVDVAAARDRRSGGDAEACDSRGGVESSVSDSERDGRERRETTPSSQPAVDYLSDLESSQATDEHRHKRCRRTPATSTAAFQLQQRSRMPAAEEIEEFFAAAEKAQAERFAAKYNFDVALGVPLDAGRFEWKPVATL